MKTLAHQAAHRGHHCSSTALQIAQPPNPHILLEKEKVGEIPDVSAFVGCHKDKGATMFYDRTAGVLVLVQRCRVIVNTTEMHT